MNPGSMRSDYGKLLYMLMDSSDPYVRELLEFDCVKPLRTGECLCYVAECTCIHPVT